VVVAEVEELLSTPIMLTFPVRGVAIPLTVTPAWSPTFSWSMRDRPIVVDTSYCPGPGIVTVFDVEFAETVCPLVIVTAATVPPIGLVSTVPVKLCAATAMFA